MAPEVYTLEFESFDANSNVKSALKTDTIEITIEAVEEEIIYTEEHKPYFSDPPSQDKYEVEVGDLK